MSAFVWRPTLLKPVVVTEHIFALPRVSGIRFGLNLWSLKFAQTIFINQFLQKYTVASTHTDLIMLPANNDSLTYTSHITGMCEQVQKTCSCLEGCASDAPTLHDYICTGRWYQCNNGAIVDVGAHFVCKGQVRILADVLTILIDILIFPDLFAGR